MHMEPSGPPMLSVLSCIAVKFTSTTSQVCASVIQALCLSNNVIHLLGRVVVLSDASLWSPGCGHMCTYAYAHVYIITELARAAAQLVHWLDCASICGFVANLLRALFTPL
jgi:hypothetical protein